MKSNIAYAKLSEIADIIDSLHQTPKYCNKGIPMVRVTDVQLGDINLSNCLMVSEDDYEKYTAKHKPCIGDIVISRVGSYGNFSYVASTDKFCLGQNTAIISPKINSRYLYYALVSPSIKQQIEQMVVGSTQKTISLKNIKELKIALFDEDTLSRIASFLESIDRKISVNKRINDNLQQQLRAIFKAEFTDNPELEKMIQIPLSELCHVVTKGTTPTTLGKPFVESGINFIKAESILDDHSIDKSKFAFIDEETNALLKRSVIHAGDVVFTIAGTLGRFALIDDNVLPANTNQAVAIIRADVEKVLPEYIYTCFIGEWHTDYYAKRIQQAVQANLSLTTIKSLPIPLLDDVKMGEYLRLILPIIKTIKVNEAQNEKLASLRDSLLPMLMSGEIDVAHIQI